MVGHYSKGKWRDMFGNEIKCFKCGDNECRGSESLPLQNGGYRELLYCSKHKKDAKEHVKKVIDKIRKVNIRISNT